MLGLLSGWGFEKMITKNNKLLLVLALCSLSALPSGCADKLHTSSTYAAANLDGNTPSTGAAGGSRRLFVTATTTDGNLAAGIPGAGLTGGDAFCQTDADTFGLGGTWIAYLSVVGTNAIDRIADHAYYEVDRTTLIFPNKAALTTTGPSNSILMGPDGLFYGHKFWTGTKSDGTDDLFKNCSNWTNAFVGNGLAGTSSTGSSAWQSDANAGGVSCSTSINMALLCFEQ